MTASKQSSKNVVESTYPGTRILEFQAPQFDDHGGIMITISHRILGAQLVISIPLVEADFLGFEPFRNLPQTTDAMVL